MKYIFVTCLCVLIGCTTAKKEKISSSLLPVLDLSKEYPIRDVSLNDIANIEYVPLETIDESLLPNMCVFFDVSEKYIITYDIVGGSVFLFTRQGKFIRKINYLGAGSKEYLGLNELIVDFENEELFIASFNNKAIFVYSFDGEYRRELPLKTYHMQVDPWYNYSEEYLIGCNIFFDFKKQKSLDESPYFLYNKRDGSMHSSKMKIPNRITSCLKAQVIKIDESTSYGHRAYLPIKSMLQNGSEILLADFTLDTLYSLKGNEMQPIAIQYPSVRSSDPPIVIAPSVYTDSFMFFRAISMYYDEKDEWKPYNEVPQLVWNRRTNEIERWRVFNSMGQETKQLEEPYLANRSLPKNTISLYYTAANVIKAAETGRASKKLKDIASKLHEEDNHVVVIVEFK